MPAPECLIRFWFLNFRKVQGERSGSTPWGGFKREPEDRFYGVAEEERKRRASRRETKEVISPPSRTTAFPRRFINVTRVKKSGSWHEEERRGDEGRESICKYRAGTAGSREAFSKLKVNVVYKRFRREINS